MTQPIRPFEGTFDVILAMDSKFGIGKNGGLPWPKLKGDMKNFRAVTAASPAGDQVPAVIMGRKTFESVEIAKRPLPKRHNIVLTSDPAYQADGVSVAHHLDEALSIAQRLNSYNIFIIGGAQLYEQTIGSPGCRYIYLTTVDGEYGCDTFVSPTILDYAVSSKNTYANEMVTENGVGYKIQMLESK